MGPDQNKGKLDNRVRVINPDGAIQMKTIGVETDVINDFRENATTSVTYSINANLATFLAGIFPIIVPVPLPDKSTSKDKFWSVGTTKVINTFGILKETIAFDAGAQVSTRNLAWDAETGEVLVTETVDEYNERYYTLNYPAHWYYKGMAQATLNLGFTGTLNNISGNTYSISGVSSPYSASDFLIEGDEIYVFSGSSGTRTWVSAVTGNTFNLITESGSAYNSGSGNFEIIRSGHRNLQSGGIMNVTLTRNPLQDLLGNDLQMINSNYMLATSSNYMNWKIINAGAVDYSDEWEVGCECGLDLMTGTYNPYAVNEKGVWRTKSSRTYLAGRNDQSELTPRREGYFKTFQPMYKKAVGGGWIKDMTNWTFVAEVTKYSPFGFELENRDALDRHSAAQYGYNNTFPMAVGANTQYREIGFDGFEDYGFDGCTQDAHFSFKDADQTGVSSAEWHTGKYSFKVVAADSTTLSKVIKCTEPEP